MFRGRRSALIVAALLAASAAGGYAGSAWRKHHERRTPNLSSFESDRFGRLKAFPGKEEIPCPQQTSRTAVLLLLGQSNAANYGGQRFESDRVVAYFEGRCFRARSPLLGASGRYGEPWTLLGDELLRARTFDAVILVPSAVGGSKIARWVKGADLNNAMATPSYKITHVLWHQGEVDFAQGTPEREYASSFVSLVDSLRARDITAPVFVSVASRCARNWTSDNAVARAQRSVVDPAKNVFPGVDTDELVQDIDRYDGCHFAGTGLEKFAVAWAELLRRHEQARPVPAMR